MLEKDTKNKNCPFCNWQSKILAKNSVAFASADKYPIVKDHTLIISVRHVASFFDLKNNERIAFFALIDKIRRSILKKDKTVTGFNIGINDGLDAGQTIFHVHIHIIPRRKGDVAKPRGGIRNIIPGKSGYR